jgi:lysozyme
MVRSQLLRASLAVLVMATSSCAAAPDDIGSSSAAVTVCGQTSVKGIDVYHGDNGGAAIDWKSVKSDGIDFAFAKATESTNFTDPMFSANWTGMQSAGLVRGAYHFFHADVDPVAQANYFLAAVGTVSAGDLLVLDLETTNGETQATIATNAATFLSTVETSSGVTPFLYTSPAFLSSFTGLGGYPLWVANYGVSCPDVPAAWTTYTFWQSSSTGSISAISGALDLDSFNGTLAQLEALGAPPSTDAGSTTDADTVDDASDGGAVGSEPSDDGSTQGGSDADKPNTGEPSGTQGGSGGCSIDRPERSPSFGVLLLLGLLAISARRRQRR